MKESLGQIVDYLLENTDYNKQQIIMIINPLKTKDQAIQFLNWIKQQEAMDWSIMRRKALELSEN